MANNGDSASADLSSVHLRLPKYWTADPEVWFAQIESQFCTYRITSEIRMFHHVVAALPPEIATEVRDLILTPPATDPYTILKKELVKRTSESEQRRLQQLLTSEELGDRKPSQLLRRLQQLLGERASSFDTSLLKELFLQRLPTNVRMVLATAPDLQLAALAQLADSVMDVATPTVAQLQQPQEPSRPVMTSAVSSHSSELNELRDMFCRQLADLRNDISAISLRSRSSSRRRGDSTNLRQRSNSPHPRVCWYHRTFGNQARNCTLPCAAAENFNPHH